MDRSEFEEDPLARPLFVDSSTSSKRMLRRCPLHEGNQASIWVGVVLFFPLQIAAILLPFLTYEELERTERGANLGYPDATFMSDFGLQNEEDVASGLKHCMTCFFST